MARFDKVDPTVGMHRAPLKADVAEADWNKVLPVGIDASGLMEVKVPSNSGFVGVTIIDRTKRKAGQIQDIMSHGEIVEVVGLTAGTKYYVQANGTLGTTRTPFYVGYTIEADRLVVLFDGKADAA